MSAALLEVSDLQLEVAGRTLCRGLNFSVRPGQVWAVLGGNGAGKSSLLHALAGLRPLQGGAVHWFGQPLATLDRLALARLRGLLLQGDEDGFDTPVFDVVLTGRYPHAPGWQWESAADRAAADEALAALDLRAFAQRSLATLSGGERRRVALAALLAQAPQVYLLDEPDQHLDLHARMAVLDVLCARARAQPAGLLMVLHDLNLAARYCDQVLLFYGDGGCEAGPAAGLLNEANLSRLYRHPIVALDGPAGRVYCPR